MSQRRHLTLVLLGLAAAAAALFAYKVWVVGIPVNARMALDVWDIELRLDFEATGGPVRLDLTLPKTTRRHAVLNEHFVSRGFGLTTVQDNGERRAVWSRRDAHGPQTVYFRATVRALPHEDLPAASAADPPVRSPEWTDAQREAAAAVLDEAAALSSDLDTLMGQLWRRVQAPALDDRVAVLMGESGAGPMRRLRVLRDLLRGAGYQARLAHGVALQVDVRQAPLLHWLQVREEGVWWSFDPDTGQRGLPTQLFTLWRGDTPLYRLSGGRDARLNVATALNQGTTLGMQNLAPADRAGLMRFSMLNLPLDVQSVYRILFMVPLGALVLVVLRNVIGFKTFGTFMPVLIALAFRETRLLWGVVLFVVVVGIGLALRFYLEQLKLLLVPRLASVLILVVLLMAMLSVLSHAMGIQQGLSVALFPMVILTMTIERMSIVWEERGASEAMQQGLGSLLVAALAYGVMSVQALQQWLLVFPELLLLVLVLTMSLGRYAGYRLLELRRFRAFARELNG